MKINVYDILVFEDENGNIYQDCVCRIEKGYAGQRCFIWTNGYVAEFDDEYTLVDFTYVNDDYWGKDRPDTKVHLKEIWTKVDEDTYKKVYELIDGRLTKISYCNGLKAYHKRQEVTHEQLRNFEAKRNQL